MNSVILANIYRFFGLALLQGLVLQSIGTGMENFRYLYIIVFPIFIFLLPMRTPVPLMLLLGFLIGFFVDILYDTWGIHASASVFTAYARSLVFKLFEPRGGYNVNLSPTVKNLGPRWFFQYTSVLMFLHLFFYFSVEAFTFVYIVDILLKTIVSFVLSMAFLMVFQLIFNPKE
jgi:hypothetical protein